MDSRGHEHTDSGHGCTQGSPLDDFHGGMGGLRLTLLFRFLPMGIGQKPEKRSGGETSRISFGKTKIQQEYPAVG